MSIKKGNSTIAGVLTGFTSPMTSEGDIIIGDAGGIATRLSIGSNGQVLKSNGTTMAWSNLPDSDNTTISINSDDEYQALGTLNKNVSSAVEQVYDWVGTLAEYQAQNIETLHPTWVCYITDDTSGGDTVYTKLEVNSLLNAKADTSNTYTKTETDTLLTSKADTSTTYTKTETNTLLDNKQDNLPTYTSNKFLFNNGSTLSWETPSVATTNDLFDFKWSDYEINSESWLKANTFSWHDGTTYSNAYNHLVSDMLTASKTYQNSNINKIGSLTNLNGLLSGFTTSNYATLTTSLCPLSYSWEIVHKINVTSFSSEGTIFSKNSCYSLNITTTGCLSLYLSSDGSTWNLANALTSSSTLSLNTNYYVRLKFTGTQYLVDVSTNGIAWNNYITLASSTVISNVSVYPDTLGVFNNGSSIVNPFNGNIDLNESYIKVNNSLVWRGCNYIYIATDGHKLVMPELENWVISEYNYNGSAWYYILDTANTRFKLPRGNHGQVIKNYVNGINGYRIYHDGWCEQWGSCNIAQNTQTTVTMTKTFSDTNYLVLITAAKSGIQIGGDGNFTVEYISTNQFKWSNGDDFAGYGHWRASGFLAPSEYENFNYLKNLYFFIGIHTPTATQQTAGLNTTLFNNKVDLDGKNADFHFVIEKQDPTSANNYTWYRIYNDDWVEQGAFNYVGSSTASANYTITLPVPMANTYFTAVFGQMHSTGGSADWGGENYNNRTTTTISLHCSSAGWFGFYWEVKGKRAAVS